MWQREGNKKALPRCERKRACKCCLPFIFPRAVLCEAGIGTVLHEEMVARVSQGLLPPPFWMNVGDKVVR